MVPNAVIIEVTDLIEIDTDYVWKNIGLYQSQGCQAYLLTLNPDEVLHIPHMFCK